MDMTACRPEKSLRKHFYVLHLSNFSQVKNMQNLYLPDNQLIIIYTCSWPVEKSAGGEHMVSISVHSCLRRNQ